MTKAEMIEALSWFRDNAPLHIAVPHPALKHLDEVFGVAEVRYVLNRGRIEIVAKRQTDGVNGDNDV